MSHDCYSITPTSRFQRGLYFLSRAVLLWGGRRQQWLHGFSWNEPLRGGGVRVCAVRRGIHLFWNSHAPPSALAYSAWSSPVCRRSVLSYLARRERFCFVCLVWVLIRVCKQYPSTLAGGGLSLSPSDMRCRVPLPQRHALLLCLRARWLA